jgi:predicted nucleic acid-binding protein
MKARYSIDNIDKLKDREFFFDANILIYLFWPTGSHSWEESYSSIFNQLFRSNKMIINYTVVSEVVNRVIQTEYKKYLKNEDLSRDKLSYKQYRNSEEGQGAIKDIYYLLKDTILPFFDVNDAEYSIDVINSFLELDSLDFGDKAIEYLCRENNYILLTNDSDFKNSDIELLSSNPTILRS